MVCDAAISDREGYARIVDSGRDGGTATLYGDTGQHIDVPTTPLDSWAEQQGWPRIDLIKMDIEGAEVAALTGMRRVRERNPHLTLIIEFNPITLGYAGLEPAALLHALQSCGFSDISIIGAKLRPLDLPKEIAFAIKQAHRWDLVNLLCR
jgi:hypothetical protein